MTEHSPLEAEHKTKEPNEQQELSELVVDEQDEKETTQKYITEEEAKEIRLRALAEMENFKKRLQKEHDEQIRYSIDGLLTDMLPVLDSLDLAIQYGSNDDACKDILMGVSMTRKLFLDTLKQYGVSVVGELSEPFNPELHEAIAHEECEDIPEGHITTLHQRGYQLYERLLRPAKVSISANKNTSNTNE